MVKQSLSLYCTLLLHMIVFMQKIASACQRFTSVSQRFASVSQLDAYSSKPKYSICFLKFCPQIWHRVSPNQPQTYPCIMHNHYQCVLTDMLKQRSNICRHLHADKAHTHTKANHPHSHKDLCVCCPAKSQKIKPNHIQLLACFLVQDILGVAQTVSQLSKLQDTLIISSMDTTTKGSCGTKTVSTNIIF